MMPEQTALLRKARESIKAAKLLNSQGMPDFSVSRSYYAMFYVAQAFLLGKGLSFSKHSGVIAAFGQHFTKTGILPAEFHQYLIEAHEDRNVGDYGIGPAISSIEADEQIAHTEKFLEWAERLI